MAAGLKTVLCTSATYRFSSVLTWRYGSVLHTRPFSSVQSTQSLSPAVRYLVDTNRLDPTVISPTGPKNRLLKGDVLKYMADLKSGTVSSISDSLKKPTSTSSKPVKPVRQDGEQSFIDIPLTNMRKTISKRLTLSKTTIPYAYAVIDCRVDKLLQLRKLVLQERNMKVTVNDLLVKAVALTLQRIPEANAIWNGDTVETLHDIDVSVAVATDGGLITPIIAGANQLSVVEISSRIKDLAGRARSGKLKPHEYQGGSFCLSNLGMFGVTEFSAIINPPQSGILAVGGVGLKPYLFDTDSNTSYDEGSVVKMISATLSCDCRVIDYELASKWLAVFKQILESPIQGLI